MNKLATIALLTVASLLLAGCVENKIVDTEKEKQTAQQLATLQAQYNALNAEKTALEGNLAGLTRDKADCGAQLAQSEQAATAAKGDKASALAQVRAALANSSSSASADSLRADALAKYSDMDSLGCRYYLLTGGYSSSTSVSVPLHCVLRISEYLDASKSYLQSPSSSAAETAVSLIDNLTK